MNRILRACLNIGCAAEDLTGFHATRLAITGNDSQGGGSATEVDDGIADDIDENTDDEDKANLDDDEDGTRSRRSRSDIAYDDLKSDRDKLRNDLEAQQRENQEFRERLTRIETEKTARQETNERTNASMDLSKRRSREIMDEIAKLDANDPERGVKIYESLLGKVYEDLPKVAEEVSRRTSRETISQQERDRKQLEAATEITLKELEKQGLKPEHFRFVRALATDMDVEDPGWFQRTKKEDQIPELVGMLKDTIVQNKRGSQEFKDEKEAHRTPMRGVIEKGSRSRPSARQQEEQGDEQEGPGSILTDMANIRKARLRNTNSMLRQADSFRGGR